MRDESGTLCAGRKKPEKLFQHLYFVGVHTAG